MTTSAIAHEAAAETAESPESTPPLDAALPVSEPTSEPASGMARFGRALWRAERPFLAVAVGMWLGDVALLWRTHAASGWKPWLTGMGAALFVLATTMLVAGAVVGPLVVSVAANAGRSARAGWAAIRADDRAGSRRLAAKLLTFSVLLMGAVIIGYPLQLYYPLYFGRAETVAAAAVLTQLLFALAMIVTWPVVERGFVAALDRIDGARPLAWLFARVWIFPALFAGFVALTFGRVVHAHRAELAGIAWMSNLPWLTALVTLLVVQRLARPVSPLQSSQPSRRSPWIARMRSIRIVGTCLVALALVGSAIAAVRVRPESSAAQVTGFERATSGRLGFGVWSTVLDFDHDGQINVLGGGDCAPFDRHRFTGATEIPGNGIDEDCDGADLAPTSIRPRSSGSAAHHVVSEHPNIVLITVDALGGPRLAALGSTSEPPLMPNIDAFAATSMLFADCFSQGPSTRLSFPAMFTSRWDSELAYVYSTRTPFSLGPSEKQIQDALDDAGYDTSAVLSNNYFGRARWPSLTRGFQHVEAAAIGSGKQNATQVTDAALKMLANHPAAMPAYLWVHYFDAHPPYEALPGVTYEHPGEQGYYEAELRRIDTQVQRLIDAAERLPQPTYIVFSADHSTVFHPHPELRKAHYGYDLYSATLHVPLIIHGPGIDPGKIDEPVSTMDIAPTIADIGHATNKTHFEGTSLTPELFEKAHDRARLVFSEYYLPEFAFRGADALGLASVHDDKWNLIVSRSTGRYEMYDWRDDYFEEKDLYEQMATSREAKHLRSVLSAFLQQVDHPKVEHIEPEHRSTGGDD